LFLHTLQGSSADGASQYWQLRHSAIGAGALTGSTGAGFDGSSCATFTLKCGLTPGLQSVQGEFLPVIILGKFEKKQSAHLRSAWILATDFS